MLHGTELLRIIEKNLSFEGISIFKGIYTADEIPRNIENNSAFIVNTSSNSGDGKLHWIGFYVRDEHHLECFDSFGENPKLYGGFIKSFVQKYRVRTRNKKCYQDKRSTVCGGYAILFILAKCEKLSFGAFVKHFRIGKRRHGTYDRYVGEFLESQSIGVKYRLIIDDSRSI